MKIPQPKPKPNVGNLLDIVPNNSFKSIIEIAKNYDGIFQLSFPNQDLILVGSQALVHELCDEKRFDKALLTPLKILRNLGGDGLFTAYTQEPNWGKAHRLLMPAFGPVAIRKMLPQMLDIAEQMLLKLERMGNEHVFDVAEEMTKLTLDTIALCSFDYRFNSFYSDELHPFVHAMVDGLAESGKRAVRLPFQQKFLFRTNQKYKADNDFMRKIGWEVINNRKREGSNSEQKDLLSIMLKNKDPLTGEALSDENIINQLITFLIAGHETTSGLLSFAIYNLLKNPDCLKKAQAEVDEVLGNEVLGLHHIPKLKYIESVLKETLRLYPTAPGFAVNPYEDTTIGDKYFVKRRQSILISTWWLHRDKKVWGDDVEAFKPTRFFEENFAKLPPNSWKPFGNGQRGCIGRSFAMQEAIIALAMLLQRFDPVLEDPNYELDIKETLTIKPEGFRIKVRRRKEVVLANTPNKKVNFLPKTKAIKKDQERLLILYGSNSGASESFANQLASEAQRYGFDPTIGPMDAYINQLEKGVRLFIVTASYEGKPPHNAAGFMSWLESLEKNELEGIEFTVLGCGHRDWVQTYQAIPKLVEQLMQQHGANLFLPRGEADAGGDFFGDFEHWSESLWNKITKEETNKEDTSLTVEITSNRSQFLQQTPFQSALVTQNRELVNMNHPLGRSKRHLEIELPEGMTYETGDYLSILPSNPKRNVDRVIRRYGLNEDTQIIINKNKSVNFHLPTGYPVSLIDILSNYVELAQPVTKKQLKILGNACPCPPEKTEILKMAVPEYYLQHVLPKRISLLDMLEKYLSIDLELGTFLELLPPLKPRQYSISSSPLSNPNRLSLTVSVVNAPAWSGLGNFEGVASNYLAYLRPDSKIRSITQPASTAFHPPKDTTIPMILVCAGSGLAPFRGFIQERALQKEKGMPIGEILLFFGCDHPDVDFLYKEEIKDWEAKGVLKTYLAFSEKVEEEVKFVQHRLWKERVEVFNLFQQQARFFVCGDGKYMAPAVKATFLKIYQELANKTKAEAQEWFYTIEKEGIRYVTDIFI